MSLIDDALKRAREKGAGAESQPPAADGARPTAPDPWSYAPMPERRRPVLVGAGIALLLAVAAIAGMLALRRDRRGTPAGPSATGASVASAAPAVPTRPTPFTTVRVAPPPGHPKFSPADSPAVGAPRPGEGSPAAIAAAPTPASTGPAAASIPIPTARVAAAPLPAAAARPAPERAAGPAPEFPSAMASGSPRIAVEPSNPPSRTRITEPVAPPPPAVHRPEPARAPAPVPARSFASVYTAPDGTKVELGGIVYSESSPVALINGRVVPVGGMVDRLTVVSIEENRIELKGDGIHVYLTLR